MRRLLTSAAFVVAMTLLVAVAPGAAVSTQTIEYSGATDFSSGAFTNEAGLVGTGSSATVEADGAHLSSAVARYAMDTGSGSTAYDSVGTNDASLTGATWTEGISNGGLTFSGSDAGAQPSSYWGPQDGDFTVSGWIKTDNTGNQQTLVGNFAGRDPLFGLVVRPDGSPFFQIRTENSDSAGAQIEGSQSVADGEWHHLVGVRDGGETRLYVDGALVGTADATGYGSVRTSSPAAIGNTPSGGQPVTGQLDEVRMFGDSLSPSEVSDLYNNPSAKLASSGTASSYTSAARSVGHSVGGEVDLELQSMDATVEWQGSTDGESSWQTLSSATYSTTGTHSQSWSEFDGDQVRVQITFDPTDQYSYLGRLTRSGITWQSSDPAIDGSTASPDTVQETVDTLPAELSVDISDADFGIPQGESLTIDWYVDGSVRKTTTATSSGTQSVQIDTLATGTHTWSVEVTDQQGATVSSQTFELAIPGELSVFDETAPSTIVDGTTLRVRFFDQGSSQVVERTVTDGTIDMTGLPATSRLVVTVNDENSGYQFRRIVLTALTAQEEIYLLPDTANSATINFKLRDSTGRFPSSSSTLFVEKPISKDFDGDGTEETRYQTIAGDNFGAAEDFPVVLQADGERYRLRVRNSQGETRALGSYTVTGSTTEPIPIGDVDFPGAETDGVALSAQLTDEDGQRAVRISYADPSETTERVTISVVRDDGTILQSETTTPGPFGVYQSTIPVPANAPENVSYNVSWTAERAGGEVVEGTERVGALEQLGSNFGIRPNLMELIGFVAIIGVLSITAIKSPAHSGIPTTATAGLLTGIGVVSIPPLLIGGAGVMSLLFAAGAQR